MVSLTHVWLLWGVCCCIVNAMSPSEMLAVMRTREGPHQSGMPSEGLDDPSKYCDPYSGVCADPSVPANGYGPHLVAVTQNLSAGTYFSAVFSDNTVLQRGPEISAVYGIVVGASKSTTVSLTINDMSSTYDVVATLSPGPTNMSQAMYWKAMLKPHDAGGNITISAACTTCANTTTTMIRNLTFGDVFFCSGQSNMWLPMQYSLTRNRTFALVDSGAAYTNIRVLKQTTAAVPDGQELYFVPPTPRQFGPTWSGWFVANSSVLVDFSATCWYFGQEIVDTMARDSITIPIGLVVSAWGGTEIEMWQPNKTINANCKTVTGDTIVNRRQGNGAIFNGMICPFVNMTIKAAIWYQGENNVGECACVNGTEGRGCRSLGPDACGNVLNGTGYACQMTNLIKQWRSYWSGTHNTTADTFPFGLVTLADGTSEGHQVNMAPFRRAQTGGYGYMPNAAMPNTFVALGHDLGDPTEPDEWSERGAGCRTGQVDYPYQMGFDARPMYESHGVQYYTNFFMGTIHPRAKQHVGRRLVAAGYPLIYGQSKRDQGVVTGPLISGCKVSADTQRHGEDLWILTLNFNTSLLGSDAVHVWKPSSQTQSDQINFFMACINDTTLSLSTTGPCQFAKSSGGASVLEAQYNNSIWFPVQLTSTGPPFIYPNSTRTANADSLTVTIPKYLPNSKTYVEITGLRYAWSAMPCCPDTYRGMIPCPPNSCPIQTFNTTLPAVPFITEIVDMKCKCYAPQVCDE